LDNIFQKLEIPIGLPFLDNNPFSVMTVSSLRNEYSPVAASPNASRTNGPFTGAIST
jgi:hypothetical protein